MSDYQQRLAAIAVLWNKIEKRAKAAEQFRGESIIAAINEMRYAGRRIVDAWAILQDPSGISGREDELEEHLVLAKNYLINADHDITDAVCFIVIKRVSLVVSEYGVLRVSTVYPGFPDDYRIVREAKEIVQCSREDRATRLAEYDKLANDYLPKLEALYLQLVESSALSVHDKATGILKDTWDKLDLLQGIALIGAVAGVLALLLGAWDVFFLHHH